MRGLMRLAWLFGVVLCAGSCDVSNTLGSDFGIQLPGCYGPSACWKVACDCEFATTALSVEEGGCMACDPTKQPNGLCDCSPTDDLGLATNLMCLEQAQVCVGTGPACTTRCVHKPADHDLGAPEIACAIEEGEPPDEVASIVGDGGQPGIAAHCSYVDDICCD